MGRRATDLPSKDAVLRGSGCLAGSLQPRKSFSFSRRNQECCDYPPLSPQYACMYSTNPWRAVGGDGVSGGLVIGRRGTPLFRCLLQAAKSPALASRYAAIFIPKTHRRANESGTLGKVSQVVGNPGLFGGSARVLATPPTFLFKVSAVDPLSPAWFLTGVSRLHPPPSHLHLDGRHFTRKFPVLYVDRAERCASSVVLLSAMGGTLPMNFPFLFTSSSFTSSPPSAASSRSPSLFVVSRATATIGASHRDETRQTISTSCHGVRACHHLPGRVSCSTLCCSLSNVDEPRIVSKRLEN